MDDSLLRAMGCGLLIGSVTVLTTWDAGIQGEEFLRYTLRATGHVSFLIFLPLLLERPLQRYYPGYLTEVIAGHRAELGLVFAGNQLWHLLFIVVLYATSESSPEPFSVLLGGAIGMLYLLLLSVFSFPRPQSHLSSTAWFWLRSVAFYYFVGIFFYDLVLRNWPAPHPLLSLVFLTAVTAHLTVRASELRDVRT